MTATPKTPAPLRLHGVDHTARPTWRLRETVAFYRDILGLPLVHVISARGWGPATHPDFLHFFFDSGQGSTIAFFYYLGSDEPEALRGRSRMRPLPEDHVFDATHTAWLVESEDELKAWKQKLQDAGLEVSVETRHEVIESIYVRDPNGYFIEFTRKLRPLGEVDSIDAALTLQAAMQAEADAESAGGRIQHIDDVWKTGWSWRMAASNRPCGSSCRASKSFHPWSRTPRVAKTAPWCRASISTASSPTARWNSSARPWDSSPPSGMACSPAASAARSTYWTGTACGSRPRGTETRAWRRPSCEIYATP
jgi:catechol 2,3-dioxygenase-like lactoylglutathione lyase family enzyme